MSETKRQIILTYDEAGVRFEWGDCNWIERVGLVELARISLETDTTKHMLSEKNMTENKSDDDT